MNTNQTFAQPSGQSTAITADTQLLLNTGMQLARPQKTDLQDAMPFVIVPEGHKIEFIDHINHEPQRMIGNIPLRDATSFITLFNRQKRGCSLIYASLDPAGFIAVIDDLLSHENALDIEGSIDNYRDFRLEFKCPASREWKTWTGIDGKHLSQLTLAEFIEDNLPDIIEPDGATMLDTCLEFEASETGAFVSKQRLQCGDHELVWKKETAQGDSGKVKLPERIKIKIPIFENGAEFELEARLRFRIPNGRLELWFELVRPHKVLETAFHEVWERIAKETGATILLGSPE